MKAYITFVASFIFVGLLFFLGELDMALDGEKMSTTALLLGGIFFCLGLHVAFLFFPFHKEEIVEALKNWFNDEEECPEEAEEETPEIKDLGLMDLGFEIQKLSSLMDDLEPMAKQPKCKEDLIVNVRTMEFVFCCYQGTSCVMTTEAYDNLP